MAVRRHGHPPSIGLRRWQGKLEIFQQELVRIRQEDALAVLAGPRVGTPDEGGVATIAYIVRYQAHLQTGPDSWRVHETDGSGRREATTDRGCSLTGTRLPVYRTARRIRAYVSGRRRGSPS